jgi:PAS domain-containing protein
MTWLEHLDGCDEVKDFLRHTTTCVIVSNPKGEIMWANNAFLAWSGYNQSELKKNGWNRISVAADDEGPDIDFVSKWDEFAPIHSTQKQCYRKNKEPVWGTLTAMRFPTSGEIRFCICTWVPATDAGSDTIGIVTNLVDHNVKTLRELQTSIEQFTSLSQEQRFIVTATELAKKYPKLTWAIIAFGFGLFGLNNFLEILKTAHIVPPSVTVAAPPQNLPHTP